MIPVPIRQPSRRAYLLRCWEEKGQDPAAPGVWRYSLEDAHTGERRGFASLEALVTYLRSMLSGELRGPTDEAER